MLLLLSLSIVVYAYLFIYLFFILVHDITENERYHFFVSKVNVFFLLVVSSHFCLLSYFTALFWYVVIYSYLPWFKSVVSLLVVLAKLLFITLCLVIFIVLFVIC